MLEHGLDTPKTPASQEDAGLREECGSNTMCQRRVVHSVGQCFGACVCNAASMGRCRSKNKYFWHQKISFKPKMFPQFFVTNLIAKPMPFASFVIAIAVVTDSKKSTTSKITSVFFALLM
jgi:hypothetical protein